MATSEALRDLSVRLQANAKALRVSAKDALDRNAALREHAEAARVRATIAREQAVAVRRQGGSFRIAWRSWWQSAGAGPPTSDRRLQGGI
jgi:hypothetical protein